MLFVVTPLLMIHYMAHGILTEPVLNMVNIGECFDSFRGEYSTHDCSIAQSKSDCRSRGLQGAQLGHASLAGIYHEIISVAISPSSTGSRRAVVSYWLKYMHKYWLPA